MAKKIALKLRAWREEKRLDRQLWMLSKNIPLIGGPMNAVRPGGRASLFRIPVGLTLIAGGFLSFLPGLGLWMLPLGVLLLAVDIPALRRPASSATIRGRRFLQRKRRSWLRR